MKVFISFADEDRNAAELIASSLVARGFDPFVDKHNLPPGRAYDERIERHISQSDIFMFLISPNSVEHGKYALTELGYAEQRWPNPDRYVLPVMIKDTSIDKVPTYLRALTILRPTGNVPAEVGSAIEKMLDLKTIQIAAMRFAIYIGSDRRIFII